MKKSSMLYRINNFVELMIKMFGLSFYVLAIPVIALMIVPPFFGFAFSSIFATAIFLGFVLFLHLSIFDTKIDIFGIVSLGDFNGKKFIFTIFILPFIVGSTLKLFNIDLNITNLYYFSQITNDIMQNIVKMNFSENKLLFQYLMMVLPMIPIILMSYFFIKIAIYWLFIGLGNSVISLYHLSLIVQ